MVLISSIPEQRTVLKNISWSTFEAILKETGDKRGYRFAYDGDVLEIMSPLYEHENPRVQLDRYMAILAEELEIEIKSAGSMTLKRSLLRKGIEPDNCYYIQSEPLVKDKQTFNLETDPPPDLAIEIDITHSSINKLELYAALGVTELWRYNGQTIKFYHLQNPNYQESEFSLTFPFLSSLELTPFLEQSKITGEITLLKTFRTWVKERLKNN
ncbi:Uma2 family endonuclease [Capilliphycus salinus ALCB114379]|uniref:Uma2 family endonuclease n=1 Tax=Capilliphycus salinus TaxID=2768948 RepID=UPI0039A721FF